jgi:hypothetical protein
MARLRLSARSGADTTAPGLYGDGDNLYLQIGPEGGKSWSCRFMLRGRQRQTGLGPVDLVSLAEARDLARDYRRLLLQGIDPIEHRRGQRQAASTAVSRVVTFRHTAPSVTSPLTKSAGAREAPQAMDVEPRGLRLSGDR